MAKEFQGKPDQPDTGDEWTPPDTEGKTPRAAFNAFLDHAKKILHPTALVDLLRPELEAMASANPEDSLIELRDKLRPVCSPKRELLRSRLAELVRTVEHYVKGNATHPFVPERLSWMIGEVAAWTPEVHSDNDMDMGNRERLALQIERLREDERWAGVDPLERTIETAMRDGFVKAVLETNELRVEFGHRLEEIATSLAQTTAQPATPTATPTAAPAERIAWGSSTAAFAYIFRTMTERGYFQIPRKGGKENEPNVTAFARVLLQAFDVKGEGGTSLTAEQLRVRLSDAAPRPLADTKRNKFQIPQAGELIVPKAEELE